MSFQSSSHFDPTSLLIVRKEIDQSINTNTNTQHDIPLIFPTESELEAHQVWINTFKEKNEKDSLFAVSETKLLES